ncbi:MAG: UDP-N-acetylmuramoyl-L-alanine--D-glutamate ligase [Rhodospirillaceae bacterium]|nr:UDP-N-acetylmuramoyl-L-alanine--D-glutamate ligase [Rhodospirillaceae bacterium]
MVPVFTYAGSRVGVMGLGKSGLSAAAALKAGGAAVCVWDDKPEAREAARKAGWALMDPEAIRLDLSVIVWSPGVPHTRPKPHPLAVKAHAQSIPLVCDVDLLCRAQEGASFIGITGTNGKSTTTALTAHVLRCANRAVEVGGNLGTPALDLGSIGPLGTYVLELSSYQLELVPSLSLETAVFLNITPDHIDRHGDIQGYVAAKKRIFENQRFPRTAVIGIDDPYCAALRDELVRGGLHNVIPISTKQTARGGVYVDGGLLMDATQGHATVLTDLRAIPTLPGEHNWQNAAAVTAAALSQGISATTIVNALTTFKGLAHRQELVATVNGVAFINDSKATNADAAEKALRCYENIYWIAGGIAKEGGIVPLKPLFPRIRHAYLIGEAADDFADTLETNKVTHDLYEDLETAIEDAGNRAMADKLPGAVVLLSPACASFDMFKSFEHRGDVFRSEVLELWPQDQDKDKTKSGRAA